jgi:hypothetical protein
MDHEAIYKAYPTIITIDDKNAYDKDMKIVSIDDAKVKTARTQLDADYAKIKYKDDRRPEYPSIEDQLDDLYHNGIDGWKATIKKTKDKYPKP